MSKRQICRVDGSSSGSLADIAPAMTDVEKFRKDARKIFDLCAQGRATVGLEIFPKLLRGLGMDPTKATIKSMWEEMDTNKNGEVDSEEFSFS